MLQQHIEGVVEGAVEKLVGTTRRQVEAEVEALADRYSLDPASGLVRPEDEEEFGELRGGACRCRSFAFGDLGKRQFCFLGPLCLKLGDAHALIFL